MLRECISKDLFVQLTTILFLAWTCPLENDVRTTRNSVSYHFEILTSIESAWTFCFFFFGGIISRSIECDIKSTNIYTAAFNLRTFTKDAPWTRWYEFEVQGSCEIETFWMACPVPHVVIAALHPFPRAVTLRDPPLYFWMRPTSQYVIFRVCKLVHVNNLSIKNLV